MKKIHVSVSTNDNRRDVLLIGYTSDGGFFLADLSLTQNNYFITKLYNIPKFGESIIPQNPKKEWVTSRKPKVTHHVDGNVHISGSGIKSGFYSLFKKAKGIFNKSTDLILINHDGGPIFTYLFWGLEQFKNSNSKDQLVINYNDIITSPVFPPQKNLGFLIEGYYLPNRFLKNINLSTGNLAFRHPSMGIIPLKYIPGSEGKTGFIAISCVKTNHEFNSNYGFTMNIAAGFIDKNGGYDSIYVIYPHEKIVQKKCKTIELRKKDIIISVVDKLIAKIIKYIRRK